MPRNPVFYYSNFLSICKHENHKITYYFSYNWAAACNLQKRAIRSCTDNPSFRFCINTGRISSLASEPPSAAHCPQNRLTAVPMSVQRGLTMSSVPERTALSRAAAVSP